MKQDTIFAARMHYKEDCGLKSNKMVPIGEVSELADEYDLGSCAERRGGSSPPLPHHKVSMIAEP